MELLEIKKHWENWSETFKTELQATTKTATIKKLEIASLARALEKIFYTSSDKLNILEVGCGNGYNCYALAELFSHCNFTGVDYISGMIENAKKNQIRNKNANLDFLIGDAINLKENQNLKENYDIVFTDRCIINLNTHELQCKALDQMIHKLKSNGHLIILENFIQSHAKQNACRAMVGLSERKPSEFNVFLDTDSFLSYLNNSMELIHIDDFGSLHDIVLYVLVPLINEGKIDYDHELVKAATDLSIPLSKKYPNAFGDFGQNRLFLFRKK